MDTAAILSAIDNEIDRLTQAKAILSSVGKATIPGVGKRGPGHPKSATVPPAPKKRVMSEEARARIAAAQKKRWAASKAEK